ncbi:transcription/translation regulatory transformer protein RfaH [Celerinatantimonas sp. YJH-8]|uniref:transcription/translation regulatory transformer protein RfaH n=1 Tax=Celerinatantimonas sp. YJH-8 TaxID=3228714 RepID=UPI0038C9288E
MDNSMPWHLLYCKARNEKRAEMHLANQGVVSFFPVFSSERILRGKKTKVIEPVFPNYLFVKMTEQTSFTSIRSTRGVSDFVRVGNTPVKVPANLVYQLMSRSDTDELNEAVSQQLCLLPKIGDKVWIKDGPYRGLDAIYQKADGLERSILLINLLHQEVEICVENAELAF